MELLLVLMSLNDGLTQRTFTEIADKIMGISPNANNTANVTIPENITLTALLETNTRLTQEVKVIVDVLF